MLWIITGVFILFIALGCPIGFSMGIGNLVGAYLMKIQLPVIAQRMFTGVDSTTLIAVPLFILTGEIMNAGGITEKLIRFANSLVGHLSGGLAHVVVVTNMIMAGISGSAVADASATGSILIPAMIKVKYRKEFATVVAGFAGTIGPLIPPSIPAVVYGCVGGVSIGKLFLGGAVPGVLLGLVMMGYIAIVARRENLPKTSNFSFKEVALSSLDAAAALVLPLIIMGGIISGIFTPTEAAGVAAAYCMIVGFYYKKLSLQNLPGIFLRTIETSSIVLFIISIASLYGWLMATAHAPELAENILLSISQNKYVVLILINILVLSLGCFLEGIAIIILFTPMFLPIITKLGIDPVFFGVLLVFNLMIGTITPPVGVVMYVVTSISKISIESFSREMLPWLLLMIALLLLMTFFPIIIMFLPNALM